MPIANMKPVQPDAVLATVVGAAPLARTEITKRLWAYIKAHNLQDATDRRQINADDTLRPILGAEHISMLKLATCVSAHVSPVVD